MAFSSKAGLTKPSCRISKAAYAAFGFLVFHSLQGQICDDAATVFAVRGA
jgi:hypothetical protein